MSESGAAEHVTAVVIGAGHAGLAASYFLSERSIDHVVLERGEVANSWRRERWDSLRLLTPNRLNDLPAHPYEGTDPDGYLTTGEVIELIERFASDSRAPVRTGVDVTSLRRTGDEYDVTTSHGKIRCRTAVVASGACNKPTVPGFRDALPASVEQVTPFDYHNPEQLPDGAVLVVGGSATGVQLTAELRRSGRPVTLSVGEHVRLPRTYRGHDVLWWMDASGVWDERYDEVDDLDRARRLPSPQLVGTPERATLDLNALMDLGVELVGRWGSVRDGEALFSGGLRNTFSLADLKMRRLLGSFDEWARTHGHDDAMDRPEHVAATRAPAMTRLRVDLQSGEFQAVVWATGYRPDYAWLDVPVLDEKGRLRHDGGVVESPGLYVLGLPVLRRRKSTFIHGIEDDAREVIGHLARYLGVREAGGTRETRWGRGSATWG